MSLQVECPKWIRTTFIYAALGAYPKEAYAVLFGRRTRRGIRIIDIWFPEDQCKYATSYGIEAISGHRPWMRKAQDIAESEGLEIVGDIHSHSGVAGAADASPSARDWETNKADWVMGVCRVHRQRGKFTSSTVFWYGQPKMRTRWV